jgi:hypothetical protein
MSSITIETANKIVRLLGKYSESQIIQKILSEVFDNDNDENVGSVPLLEPEDRTTTSNTPISKGDFDAY